jgi:hypothetical protein
MIEQRLPLRVHERLAAERVAFLFRVIVALINGRKLPLLWLRTFSIVGNATPSAAMPEAQVRRRS